MHKKFWQCLLLSTLALLWLRAGSAGAQTPPPVDWPTLEESIDRQVERLRFNLPDLRRGFYRYPELPGKPLRTTNIIGKTMQVERFSVRRIGHSVVGTLSGDRPGPTVAIRFEMDAVSQENPIDNPRLRTRVEGVRHALGNDAQLALASSLARLFLQLKPEMPGTIRLIVQSGSSELQGAAELLEENMLEHRPAVEIMIGVKMAPLPAGTIALHSGQATAAGVAFEAELRNRSEDEFEKQLQNLANNLGLAPGWDEAEFFKRHAQSRAESESLFLLRWGRPQGETFYPSYRGQLLATDLESLRSAREALLRALDPGADLVLRFPSQEIPPVRNNPDLTERVLGYLREAFDPETILMLNQPNPFLADDFSLFQGNLKTVLLWFGVANADRGIKALPRDPAYDLDERSLGTALSALAKLSLRYMTERVNGASQPAAAPGIEPSGDPN